MLSNGNKQHRKNQSSTFSNLIKTQKSLSYPLIFTLWYTKISNLHKTGKFETEKTYVLSSEVLETETPKNEKLGNKLTILQYPLKAMFALYVKELSKRWPYNCFFLEFNPTIFLQGIH